MPGSLFRFDAFEIDRDNFQLRNSGQSVHLQKVPLELLLFLAEKEGQLVTRAEITERIWGKDVFLDADSAVSTAIRKIRSALGDDSERPKYIETVAGKGYRFIAQMRPALEEIRSVDRDAILPRPTIAVLPLEDFSVDAEDYFSEGMTEEILTHLGRLHPQLGVISRTSVMKYKGTRKSIRQIGRELGVAYALEGSVRHHAGRVRVSVQLIETLNQTHIWAESYEYLLDDILKLQDRLAREIASQISLQLKVDPPAIITSTSKMGRGAYEAYLKGRYFWNQRVEQALTQSIHCFEEAISLEPSFAAAHAGLADAYIFLGLHGLRSPADTYSKAEQAARKALALDSSIPEPYVSLAAIQDLYYWNWPAAKPLFARALQLNPSHLPARFFYAGALSEIGHPGESIRQIEIARALDPLSVITQAFAGLMFYRNRDYGRAADQVQRSLELDPRFAPSYWYLGLIRQEQGDLEAAIDALKLAVEFSLERPLYLAALGQACGRANREQDALTILEKLMKLSEVRYVSPFDVALVHMGMGNKDATFEWLEEACTQRVTRLRILREAQFDVLRSEPRFADLMRRVGLPV
jgi:TolB-like protein/Tfp pilus assembly protein PilF